MITEFGNYVKTFLKLLISTCILFGHLMNKLRCNVNCILNIFYVFVIVQNKSFCKLFLLFSVFVLSVTVCITIPIEIGAKTVEIYREVNVHDTFI